MPDSSIGNTTGLPSVTVQNMRSYGAQIAAQEVAKHNYRTRIMDDSKLNLIRQLLINRVKGWPALEKSRILTEYGFRPNKDSDLDALVVEALIIYMSPDELEKIYKQLVNDQRVIATEYKKAEAKRKALSRSAFKPDNFENFYSEFAAQRAKKRRRDANRLGKDIRRFVRQRDRLFRGGPNKVARSRYPALAKELKEVLKLFYPNIADLLNLAISMGVDPESIDAKNAGRLRAAIIEKTALYVDLIVGNVRKFPFQNAFPDPAPFDEILKYTSFAYITSGPNGRISAATLAVLKQQAKENRTRLKQENKANDQFFKKRYRRDRFLFGAFKKRKTEVFSGDEIGELRKGDKKLTAEELRTGDTGILKDYSEEQLREVALKYGIKKPHRMSVGELKLRIYDRMNRQNSLLSKTLKKQAKLQGKGKLERAARVGQKAAGLKAIGGVKNEARELNPTEFSASGVPIVRFKGDIGDVKLLNEITAAVPVIVVGNAKAGKSAIRENKAPTAKDKTEMKNAGIAVGRFNMLDTVSKKKSIQFMRDRYEIEKLKNPSNSIFDSLKDETDPDSRAKKELEIGRELMKQDYEAGKKFLKVEKYETKGTSFTEAPGSSITSGILEKLSDLTHTSNSSDNSKPALRVFAVNGGIGGGISAPAADEHVKLKIQNDLINRQAELDKLSGTNVKHHIFESDDDRRKRASEMYGSATQGTKNKSLSPHALNLAAISYLKNKKISDEAIKPVFVVNKGFNTDMLIWTQKFIEVLMAALKMSGMMAPIGFGLETGMSVMGLTGVDGYFAKGGKVKVKRDNTSSFVSGDSLNGKENRELVNIDWDKKSYKVAPIPKFAKGGTGEASGTVSPLSQSEKNQPMAVGLTSHLASYTEKVPGDDGSGKAVKVYMVNNILNNRLNAGGQETTLGDILVGLQAQLAALSNLISTGNEQRGAVISTTAAVGSAVSSLKSVLGSRSSAPVESPFGGFTNSLDGILSGS